MKFRVGFVVLLVLVAGCAAPAPESPAETTTLAETPAAPETPTQTATPPESTTEIPTTTAPQTGVAGEIRNTTVDNGVVMTTIALINYDEEATNRSIAVRFVENSSHAMVGEVTLGPSETKTLLVPLRTYDDDPANLTVQLRIDGTIVAERPAV